MIELFICHFSKIIFTIYSFNISANFTLLFFSHFHQVIISPLALKKKEMQQIKWNGYNVNVQNTKSSSIALHFHFLLQIYETK